VVVSLSKFKYGKILPNEPRVVGRAMFEKAKPRLNREDVVEGVAKLRSSIDLINDLLLDISELSVQVQDELYELECSIENLESQL
jgi:hypothetical protein